MNLKFQKSIMHRFQCNGEIMKIAEVIYKEIILEIE